MKKTVNNKQKQSKGSGVSCQYRPMAVFATTTLVIGLGLAALAANDLLHGHISVTERRNQHSPVGATQAATVKTAPITAAPSANAASDLVDKYGIAASSPRVAAAIRKAERQPDAKAASDAYEALRHGVWKPGADPMLAIMHGYVPPGMAPQQVVMLYKSLPHIPRKPRTDTMTPETADQLAGVPADPMDGLPQGLSQEGVRAANEQMIRGYIRQRLGPVYIPPFHREHNAVVPTSSVVAGRAGLQRDNQVSLIEAEYTYDPKAGEPPPRPRTINPAAVSHTIREMTDASGNVVSQYGYDPFGRQTKIGGTGPDADFGYQGYYVHQRSGLNLTRTRAYSPVLGRFLSRDPIEETGSGTNLFTYVGNNPISRQDPSGEMWKTCCKDPTVDCPKPGPYCPTVPPAKCAKDNAGGRTYFIRAFRRGYQKCVWSDNGDPEGGTYACEPTGTPQECPE